MSTQRHTQVKNQSSISNQTHKQVEAKDFS